MSRVAEYLSEHLVGEATARPTILATYMHDGGILEKRPEMVLRPRSTADVRKITLLCWQLAEKGHLVPLSIRGAGTSTRGASIGRGAIMDMGYYLHRIYEYEPKQRLVRLQPGVRVHELANALRIQGAGIALLNGIDHRATLGGVLAEGTNGNCQEKYGSLQDVVDQLEVVLPNGDVLQTGPLTKRELNRKKGLDSFEGEIYRKLDALFDDNASVLQGDEPRSRAGYPGIFSVKTKKHFDLTPLFIGSEGSLGVINEMILKTDLSVDVLSAAAILFTEKSAARDARQKLIKLDPAFIEYVDGEIVEQAIAHGKRFDALGSEHAAAVVVVGFDDSSEKSRQKNIRRVKKMFATERIVTISDERVEQILAIQAAPQFAFTSNTGTESWPPLFDNFYVPEERMEQFVTELDGLVSKYRFALPLHGDMVNGLYSARPLLYLKRVADKQKIVKLIDEFAAVLERCDGVLVGDGGEGRLLAPFAQKHLDAGLRDVYREIKTIFDPHGILSPGVKEPDSLRDTVTMLRSDY